MKKTALKLFAFVVVGILMVTNVVVAKAAPRFTLTPVSGSYNNGSTFTVSIGVNSETSKSSAVDVWGTFDASKLEVVSINKSANPPFDFDMTPRIDNINGKFNFSCASTDTIASNDATINGELAVVTFRAKATGAANLNFTCTSGSTTDSNIFDSNLNDVISCGDNNSGSYTINSSDSGSTTATSTPTPTPTTSTSTVTATATELPKTGGVSSTIGLIVFGAISLASALFLKFL
jgi:LPXTG-motif cell wall-anchored protein